MLKPMRPAAESVTDSDVSADLPGEAGTSVGMAKVGSTPEKTVTGGGGRLGISGRLDGSSDFIATQAASRPSTTPLEFTSATMTGSVRLAWSKPESRATTTREISEESKPSRLPLPLASPKKLAL